MNTTDTIVALATPPTPARRAIVRISGPRSLATLAALSLSPSTPGGGRGEGESIARSETTFAAPKNPPTGPLPEYREGEQERERAAESRAIVLRLADDPHDVGLDVPATAWIFFAPRSATGDDVVEIHLPGSPFLVRRLLDRLFALGARQAEAGEFTARAFFHGKLSLAAAEGVVATIAASNRAELDAARQLLSGELARRLASPMDRLTRALALIEVGIDFSEEDVTFISRDDVAAAVEAVREELEQLLAGSARFETLRHEPKIVLAGRPNAGKSTLLNALAGHERAVVSDIAGTTRDALCATIALKSGLVTIIDVAGLDRDGEDRSTDARIADQMHAAADRAIASADVLVRVIDSTDDRSPLDLGRAPDLAVYTKGDLIDPLPPATSNALFISVTAASGLATLRDRLDALAFPRSAAEQVSSLALNARHVDEIRAAIRSLDRSTQVLDVGPEFVASELRSALNHLGRILGAVSPDDVLGRIFSSFCIGK